MATDNSAKIVPEPNKTFRQPHPAHHALHPNVTLLHRGKRKILQGRHEDAS
ncbi:hypothetical protein [Sphingomonas tagetis]|uniref:hypothetical protein n=1 Tax=Sphingomonas tagetis TaxID=2949092 RepID=UPI0020B819D8|nr:hypothetical protein [Sphingomonas tagetis]